MEMAIKVEAYKRQEATKLKESLKSHRVDTGDVYSFQQKKQVKQALGRKEDPEQQKIYHAAFSAALKRLP